MKISKRGTLIAALGIGLSMSIGTTGVFAAGGVGSAGAGIGVATGDAGALGGQGMAGQPGTVGGGVSNAANATRGQRLRTGAATSTAPATLGGSVSGSGGPVGLQNRTAGNSAVENVPAGTAPPPVVAKKIGHRNAQANPSVASNPGAAYPNGVNSGNTTTNMTGNAALSRQQ